MHNERFFDQTLAMIQRGQSGVALPMLAGKLYNACADGSSWPTTRSALRRHPLHAALMEDPFCSYSAKRPRGYPGDAGLIDIIYDKTTPEPATDLGRELFEVSVCSS